MKNSKKHAEEQCKKCVPHFLLYQFVILLIAYGISGLTYASELSESIQTQEITVYKAPSCGCCTKWAEHLEENGFEVDTRTINNTGSVKKKVGVPSGMGSCHTAIVGGYWVEGHVPADVIQKLLSERPENIKGIAVPGMPLGSPGMESPNPVEYEILSVDGSGNVEVYATRMGKSFD